LPIPLVPAEIKGGAGFDVLKGKARFENMECADVTSNFLKGVYET
jgi:uncharacterized protein YbbK (DUF523 family)